MTHREAREQWELQLTVLTNPHSSYRQTKRVFTLTEYRNVASHTQSYCFSNIQCCVPFKYIKGNQLILTQDGFMGMVNNLQTVMYADVCDWGYQ